MEQLKTYALVKEFLKQLTHIKIEQDRKAEELRLETLNTKYYMNKDTINLIKDGASTVLDIVQMTHYRMKYLQDRDAESKEKMIKYTILSGVVILSLLTIGVLGLMESRRNCNSCYTDEF